MTAAATDFPNDPRHPLAGYKAGPPPVGTDGSPFIRYDCVVAWNDDEDQHHAVLTVDPVVGRVWDEATRRKKSPPDEVIGHRRITPPFNCVTGEATDDPADLEPPPPEPPKRPTPPDFAGYVRCVLPFAREMVGDEWPDADRREAVRLADVVVGGLPEGWSSTQTAELARGRGATTLAQHAALFAVTHSTAVRVVVFCGSRNEAEDAAHGLIVETREAVNAGLHRFGTNPRVLRLSVPTVAVDDSDHPSTIVFAWDGDDCRFALGTERADLLICDRASPKDQAMWDLMGRGGEVPTIEFVTPEPESKLAELRRTNAETIAKAVGMTDAATAEKELSATIATGA
ncbi:hypothetical protein [Alienimonas sp. DA493]|uniref:hypothetical protein n=1 Tax=Alienimonas sp. DA493 TaxID=3373605 RepID=UPI0037540AAB